MCLSFKIIKQKQKTQFAFCYLHVDLKRETFRTRYRHPLHWPWPQPQTRGLCMLRNIDLDAARCSLPRLPGMHRDEARHSDDAINKTKEMPERARVACGFSIFHRNTMKQTDRAANVRTSPSGIACLPPWHDTETWRNIVPALILSSCV